MLLLETADVCMLIKKVGLSNLFVKLCEYLTTDFLNWEQFQKSKRHAFYVPNGVIELMPICNNDLYSFKYVNGHPYNPLTNKLNVVAFGVLADVESGYPLMISSMTLLTAVRTAATSALSSHYMAKPDSKRIAIIGCGAQSEFQILAHHALFSLEEVYYFDIDESAMKRFAHNLQSESFQLISANNVQEAVQNADIIITATAAKGKQEILKFEHLHPGQHICGIGGDSPGKTELDPNILKQAKVVVEYLPQSMHEGEIQNLGSEASAHVYAELWEVVSERKIVREHLSDITVFDSVGFAIEDFSTLRLCYQIAAELGIGKKIDLISHSIIDSKNLYGLIFER